MVDANCTFFFTLIVHLLLLLNPTQSWTVSKYIDPRSTSVPTKSNLSFPHKMYRDSQETGTAHCPNVLFVECGFGNDSHGQSATKAAVRACRNAIEFNSIPSLKRIIPSDKQLKLDVILAIPKKYQNGLDLEQCRNVFPYGDVRFTIQDGGMIAPSGVAIDDLGDSGDDMVIVNCAVVVGY